MEMNMDIDFGIGTIEEFMREAVQRGMLPTNISERLEASILRQPMEAAMKEVVVQIVRHALEYQGEEVAQKVGVLAGCMILLKVFDVALGNVKEMREELACLHRTIQMLELP